MTAAVTQKPLVPGRLEQKSTRLAFFIAGFGVAAWAPLVPYAKARAGLDEATLGLLLLCLGAGSILAMPIAGMLASRYGCRKVTIAGTLLICLALPLLATASTVALLIATLFVFGAGLGVVDSTVNLQAVIVERASGRNMMSGFHGLFSVGGIAGAAGVSALLALGLTPLWAIAVVIVLAMNLVGSLLISALVIFPALSAMRLFQNFRSVTVCSAVLSVSCAALGILIAILAGTPVGSTIVAVDILAFLICSTIGRARGGGTG